MSYIARNVFCFSSQVGGGGINIGGSATGGVAGASPSEELGGTEQWLAELFEPIRQQYYMPPAVQEQLRTSIPLFLQRRTAPLLCLAAAILQRLLHPLARYASRKFSFCGRSPGTRIATLLVCPPPVTKAAAVKRHASASQWPAG